VPRATVNLEETERVALASCPGGYVVLRRLTYGQLLHRRSMAASLRVQSGKGNSFSGEMQMVNEAVTRYEFASCVLDHNLEDDAGRKLNLTAEVDIQRLDPRVGEEIARHISRMNDLDGATDDTGTAEGGGPGNS
jgi:hypothetical protein